MLQNRRQMVTPKRAYYWDEPRQGFAPRYHFGSIARRKQGSSRRAATAQRNAKRNRKTPRDGERRYSPAEVVDVKVIPRAGMPEYERTCTSHRTAQSGEKIRRLTRLTTLSVINEKPGGQRRSRLSSAVVILK